MPIFKWMTEFDPDSDIEEPIHQYKHDLSSRILKDMTFVSSPSTPSSLRSGHSAD